MDETTAPATTGGSPATPESQGVSGSQGASGQVEPPWRQALRRAKRVWIATDCDREGQLIGQEILEHYKYRGEVMRVMFTAQDTQTIRDAFNKAKPNADYAPLYAAAVARRQADQIYNLSLTRTATVTLGKGTARLDPRTVELDLAALDRFSGDAPCPEKTGGPEPFVDALALGLFDSPGRLLGHEESGLVISFFSAASAANGLSGSMAGLRGVF